MGKFGKSLGILLVIVLLSMLGACSSSIKVNGITISSGGKTQIAVGENLTLTANVDLEDQADLPDVKVDWSIEELQTTATMVEGVAKLEIGESTLTATVIPEGTGSVKVVAETEGKSAEVNITIVDNSNDIESFSATLEGSQEVPAVTTDASGEVSVELNTEDKTITVDGNVKDLGSEVTAAHIHKAPAGENGPVEFPLDVDTSGDNTKRSAKLSGSFSVSDSQIADLKAEGWYINVHTQDNGPGEVRGQIKPK